MGRSATEMTLDTLPTHCNGQGSFHEVVGLDHWLTSLSLIRYSSREKSELLPVQFLDYRFGEIYVIGRGLGGSIFDPVFHEDRGELDHWYHLFVSID